jgi:hypothetical protein
MPPHRGEHPVSVRKSLNRGISLNPENANFGKLLAENQSRQSDNWGAG